MTWVHGLIEAVWAVVPVLVFRVCVGAGSPVRETRCDMWSWGLPDTMTRVLAGMNHWGHLLILCASPVPPPTPVIQKFMVATLDLARPCIYSTLTIHLETEWSGSMLAVDKHGKLLNKQIHKKIK